jgi:hypothetical protein
MAQAVMSMILGKPDTARARPSSLIKDNAVYSQVFSESYAVALYAIAGALIRHVDRVLRTRTELTTRDRANIRFYVLTWLASTLAQKALPSAEDIAKLDLRTLDDDQVEAAIDAVLDCYEELGSSDQAAKGPEMKRRLQVQMEAAILAKRAAAE